MKRDISIEATKGVFMRLIENVARPNWEQTADAAGFSFHTMYGEPYWDETGAYAFTLQQIENDIEAPSTELHLMAMEAAQRIIGSDDLMRRMDIPESSFGLIRESWATERNAHIYGRFDLAYNGQGPAKLYEYNADTPTSLFEAAVFQWTWLEAQIKANVLPAGSDQFNGIWEALVARWGEVMPAGARHVHFAGDLENPEDMATLRVLWETAEENGVEAHIVAISDIGYSDEDRAFLDAQDRIMGHVFKLYPWEDVLRDDFGGLIAGAHTKFVEPAWKAVLSNKGLMAVMWEMFEGHPHLLPCLFEDEMNAGSAFINRTKKLIAASGSARKPVLSREGASVTLTAPNGQIVESKSGDYGHHPHIIQAYAPLPEISGRRPVIGSWIVGDRCVGMGIRDDASAITGDLSRFRPHVIIPN